MRKLSRHRIVLAAAVLVACGSWAVVGLSRAEDDLDPIKLAREAGLKEMMVALPGQADVYLTDDGLAAGRPDLHGVKINKVVKIAGRTFWQAESGADRWVIAPESIKAIRTAR